jgi:hypothetical protein
VGRQIPPFLRHGIDIGLGQTTISYSAAATFK